MYAGYCLLAVFVTSRFLASRWSTAIDAERTMSTSELEVGDSLTVGVRLINRSRWFIPWMLIEDTIPRRDYRGPSSAWELTGSIVRLCMLKGNAQRLLPYQLKALRRGYFQVGPTVGETGDLFGLHRRFSVFCQPEYVTVLPKIVPLEGYSVESKRPVGEIQVTYRMMEDPTLIAGIRKYQMGDPLSRVHWRATARTGELHSKVFQPTSVAGAMIVLDMHERSNPKRHEPKRTDLAVTAAVSIAHTLYEMQQQFGFVSNGRDAADRAREVGWVADYRSREEAQKHARAQTDDDRLRPILLPAGRGPEHFREMHLQLARLTRSDGLELPALLAESQSRMPRDVSVIAIVQNVDETNALALGMLRRQGFAVTAIVNNFEESATLEAASRLIAEHIPVFHLRDEESIRTVCQTMLMKG